MLPSISAMYFRPSLLAVSSQICQPCQPNLSLRFQGFPVTTLSSLDSRILNRSNLPTVFVQHQQLYSLSGVCRPRSGNPCPDTNQSLRCANCRKLIKSPLLETSYQNIHTHIWNMLSPPLHFLLSYPGLKWHPINFEFNCSVR